MRSSTTAACWALLVACCLGPAWAQPSDPLQSAGCVQALSTLQDVEGQLAAGPQAASAAPHDADARRDQARAQLAKLKRQAARICLGTGSLGARGAHDQPPRGGLQVPAPPQPGPALAPKAAGSGDGGPAHGPSAPSAPSAPSTPSTRAAPSAPVTQRPLLSITSCDANGCWSSDGTRLQRFGSQLLGPRGFCNVQGSVVNCP